MTKSQTLESLLDVGSKLAYLLLDIDTTGQAKEYLSLLNKYRTPTVVVSRYLGKMDPTDIRLSTRETEAVGLFNEGKLGKEIAEWMGVTEGTVKIHLANARRKLGVKYGRSTDKVESNKPAA